MVNIGNSWDSLLAGEFDKEYYKKLRGMLAREYREYTVYPNMYDIFNALRYTPYERVKAVILGQDPYHGPGQAHGLCFSVKRGVPAPPSLQNIFKELKDDLGIDPPPHGELTSWAKQGVLLLNTVLTVRQGQPQSHLGRFGLVYGNPLPVCQLIYSKGNWLNARPRQFQSVPPAEFVPQRA